MTFHEDLLLQKTVLYTITARWSHDAFTLAVLIEHRLVTDGRTDTTITSSTVPRQCGVARLRTVRYCVSCSVFQGMSGGNRLRACSEVLFDEKCEDSWGETGELAIIEPRSSTGEQPGSIATLFDCFMIVLSSYVIGQTIYIFILSCVRSSFFFSFLA